MVPSWRNKLQEVHDAVQGGRLDDARKLLAESNVRQCAAGQRMSAEVARLIAQRAERRAASGDTTAGWRDLKKAQCLGDQGELQEARDRLIAMALCDVEKHLLADEPEAALQKLNKLHQRDVSGGEVGTLRQVVLKTERARRLCRVGNFEEAVNELTLAKTLRNDLGVIEQHLHECEALSAECRLCNQKLNQAVENGDWNTALNLSQRLLEIAPEHPFALQSRDRAWDILTAHLSESERLAHTAPWRKRGANHAEKLPVESLQLGLAEAVAVGVKPQCENRRYLLWIDGVGGYLVCLADEIQLGQAVPTTPVDVPILGNLSRRHATIRRDGEGYVIRPEGPVRVEGILISGPTMLSDGNEIELGSGVRLRFRRPHPLSATARLELLSGHRTQPPADGILLMAESAVLGPRLSSHVVCRPWEEDVILFRQGEELWCRTGGNVEIDGEELDGEGKIKPGAHVIGDDFSLCIEEL